jgi:hypothetical protein
MVPGLLWFSPNLYASAKAIACAEADQIIASCANYDRESAACDKVVDDAIKVQVDQAKKELDDCKKKHGLKAPIKCVGEQKKVATALNSPRAIAGDSAKKAELQKPDSPCAKAEAIGKSQILCKGPKQVIEETKRTCKK